jgi:hypothetical protein
MIYLRTLFCYDIGRLCELDGIYQVPVACAMSEAAMMDLPMGGLLVQGYA